MSTNLEYRARVRQTKKESRRQASEAQRLKGRQRDIFLLGGQHENFVAAVTKEKCEWPTIKYKVKMSGSEKT